MPERKKVKPSKTIVEKGKYAIIKSFDFRDEKPRGNYLTRNLVYYDKYGITSMRMGKVEIIQPGVRVDEHYANCEEIYYVLEGKGTIGVQGTDYEVEQGDMVFVGPNIWHGPHINTGNVPFRLLYVVSQIMRAHELERETHWRNEE